MYCTQCGNQISDDAKFCRKCGHPVNSSVQTISKEEQNVNNYQGSSSPSPQKPTPHRPKKKHKLRRIFLSVLLVLFLFSGAFIVLVSLDIIESPVSTKSNEDEEITYNVELKGEVLDDDSYQVTPPDADEYFEATSEVLSIINVAESHDVQSEKDVKDSFESRGFVDCTITYDYNMDGVYQGEIEISEDSSEVHPMYQTYYVTATGNVWVIFAVNGHFVANPLSYNAQSSLTAPVMISENNNMMSYDSTKNKFYEIIPYDSETILKKVERIDAETIEELTNEVIDEL